MSINGFTLNSRSVNGPALAPLIGVGTLISFEQTVLIIGSGSLFEFEQDVQFLETGSGSLISLEQAVQSIASGSMIEFSQRVIDSSIPSHESRTGWDALILVGGVQIPLDQVHGKLTVTKVEDSSTLATFTIIPPTGIQDLEAYQGKSVTIDISTNNTNTYRVFTGVVDIPDVDIIQQKITLQCTNRRRELINTTQQNVVPNIGFYNVDIFSEVDELASELDQRLTTVPQSFDFDGYNNGILTNWAPKATPDFVLDDADIYYRGPDVELSSRGRIVNTVNISFEYRYARLYHKEVSYQWNAPYTNTGSACLIIGQGYSLTPRSSIDAAARATGWLLRAPITYVDLPPNGFYRCGDANGYFTTIRTNVQTEAKREPSTTDSEGVVTLGAVITDINGNPVVDTSERSQVTDLRYTFAGGAGWIASKQWAQDISEKYTLTVASAQSVSQYGTIAEEASYGLDNAFNTDDWENPTEYVNRGLGSNYFINADTDEASFNNAVVTALQIASTKIVSSHRDTRVTLFRSIMPALELNHTVQATADKISCKGKVRQITHTLDVGTGEAVTNLQIALSRATGSGSSSTIAPPTRPTDNPALPSQLITLGNHFAQDPSSVAAQSWNGMIGNAYTGPYGSGVRTGFSESFVVDAPAISSALRDERVLGATQSYNVAIRNDSLTVNFDDQ